MFADGWLAGVYEALIERIGVANAKATKIGLEFIGDRVPTHEQIRGRSLVVVAWWFGSGRGRPQVGAPPSPAAHATGFGLRKTQPPAPRSRTTFGVTPSAFAEGSVNRVLSCSAAPDSRTLPCRTQEEPMGHEEGNGNALDELRIALASMRTRKELADPAVRVHTERYLESAEAEIAYVAALRDRASFVGQDDDRERLALDRAVRAIRLAEAKLDAAVAEKRGDRHAEAEANGGAVEIVMHLGEAEDEDDDDHK